MVKTINKYITLILVVFLALSTQSCKSRKKPVSTSTTAISADNFASIFQDKASDWDLFSCKLKVDYSDGGSSMAVNASLRMKRDSLVWVSVSMLGFEAVRAFITKDSFYIMQKMPRKSVMANNIQALSHYIGTPVTLQQLQNLILGNLILDPKSYRWSESPDEGIFYLKGRKDSLEVTQRYYFKDIAPLDVLIRSLSVYNKTTITYTGTQPSNLKPVPSGCNIKIEDAPQADPIQVKIEILSPEFPTNLTFPF